MPDTPTCPANNNYKQEYLAIKYDYDTKCLSIDTAAALTNLDNKLEQYGTSTDATRAANATQLSTAFNTISQHYANLASIKKRLNDFLECSSTEIKDAKSVSENEERYSDRVNPQDTVMPRELVFGLFSQLRPSSVPIVMAAGVFMSCLTLLIIFQMFGFTGELHIPPALTKVQAGITAVASSGTPLYQNPMVLSGVSIVLGAAVIILGALYYRSKK
jgi:hypothetical protein